MDDHERTIGKADVTGFPADRPGRRFSNLGGPTPQDWYVGCEHSGCAKKARPGASADHDCCGRAYHDITHAYWARDGRPGSAQAIERQEQFDQEMRAGNIVTAALVAGGLAFLAWLARRD